jgi:hypothetical protein
MHYNSDTVVPHSAITDIAENLQRSATFQDHCFDGCWVVDDKKWSDLDLG